MNCTRRNFLKHLRLTTFIFVLGALGVFGSISASEGKAGFGSIACDCNRDGEIPVFDAAGEIIWNLKPSRGPTLDFQMLPNGNILFTSGWHVMEVTRDKEVVFDYDAGTTAACCRRLPDGDTLIRAGSKHIHVRPDGSVAKEIQMHEDIGRALPRDGLAAANGRLYLSATDGTVRCCTTKETQ